MCLVYACIVHACVAEYHIRYFAIVSSGCGHIFGKGTDGENVGELGYIQLLVAYGKNVTLPT